MNRDSKGRFKQRLDDDETTQEVYSFLERTPSLKTFLVLILIAWLTYGFAPSPKDAGLKICGTVCNSCNTTTTEQARVEATTSAFGGAKK